MKRNQRYLTIAISVVIVILIVLAIVVAVGVFKLPKSGKNVNQELVNAPVVSHYAEPARSTYEIGLQKAREWQHDAVLARIVSPEGDTSGEWKAIFISPQVQNKGYVVAVQANALSSAEEIDFVGTGAELPENIITADQAVQQVKGMKGFEDAEVFGVEAVYGADEKLWYWGVKTDKGTVSVEAK